MAIEWKPIEGGFSSVMETALAQSKQLAPQQIDITQGFGGRFVTPEEYYTTKNNAVLSASCCHWLLASVIFSVTSLSLNVTGALFLLFSTCENASGLTTNKASSDFFHIICSFKFCRKLE